MALIWLLDDGPFEILAKWVSPEKVDRWPKGLCRVAEATARNAAQDPKRKRLLAAPAFATATIAIQDPAHRILTEHLRREDEFTRVNLAEHQGIAWLLTQEEGIFVVTDKQATVLALAELGRGRVAHAFDFWELLHQQALFDDGDVESVTRATLKRDQGLPGLPWRFGQNRGKG